MTVVAVAWILTLLSIFSLSSNREARTELWLARLGVESVQARSLARSGLRLAEELAREVSMEDGTALGDAWLESSAPLPVELGGGSFSLASSEGEEVTYGLTDEGRLLPWTLASPEMLERIPGLEPETRDALQRYREAGTRTGLLLFLSFFDTEIQEHLAQYLTPYATGGVNINTAPRAILAMLGIPSGAVDRILARRHGRDGQPATADDELFTTLLTPGGGLDDLDLTSDEAAVVSALARAGILVTRSTVFRVRSRGWVEGSRRSCELEEVIRVTPEHIEVLDWRERWRK